MKWTIEFNQTIMDKIGFSIRKSTLFNVLLIQRLKKKIKIALGVLVKKCVHLAPHIIMQLDNPKTLFCKISEAND